MSFDKQSDVFPKAHRAYFERGTNVARTIRFELWASMNRELVGLRGCVGPVGLKTDSRQNHPLEGGLGLKTFRFQQNEEPRTQ